MQILDTTIRDGSYAVDFKFSTKDVKDIVKKSEKIGIEYIEVGHGLGLNASSERYGIAMHSDEEYMIAAKSVTKDAKIGFFCIPGIARLEDIDLAKKYDINFLRMGVSVKDVEKALPYVVKARENGIEVFVNFMKTYTASCSEFAKAAEKAHNEGARGVYIVDSAGTMTEKDLDNYIDAVRGCSNVEIGFHGHNNLGLAVSNAYFCFKKNISFIDCSFQGLGRSLGNTSLEQFIMMLARNGIDLGFDIPRVVEYGYAGLRNIVKRELINPLDYICGYSGFHSSFLKDIYKCCCEKNVDPLRLIIEYSKVNKLSMDYDLLCNVAEGLPLDLDDNPYSFAEYFTDKYIA